MLHVRRRLFQEFLICYLSCLPDTDVITTLVQYFVCCIPVSEMTYTVSSGTLNSSIPYHCCIPHSFQLRRKRLACIEQCAIDAFIDRWHEYVPNADILNT